MFYSLYVISFTEKAIILQLLKLEHINRCQGIVGGSHLTMGLKEIRY